jgi:TPR repeat protein
MYFFKNFFFLMALLCAISTTNGCLVEGNLEGKSNPVRGLSVRPSNGTLIDAYMRAVKEGYEIAQYNLGVMYLKGTKDVPRNDTEAGHFLRMAADQGYEPAQIVLRALMK